VFTFRQSLKAYRNYRTLIDHCDTKICQSLDDSSRQRRRRPGPRRRKAGANHGGVASRPVQACLWRRPDENSRHPHLHRPAIVWGDRTDCTNFRSASAFALCIRLCPDNDISGGKVLWVGTRKVKCLAATALRMAAHLYISARAASDILPPYASKTPRAKAIWAAATRSVLSYVGCEGFAPVKMLRIISEPKPTPISSHQRPLVP
jgi:hypothetical protein